MAQVVVDLAGRAEAVERGQVGDGTAAAEDAFKPSRAEKSASPVGRCGLPRGSVIGLQHRRYLATRHPVDPSRHSAGAALGQARKRNDSERVEVQRCRAVATFEAVGEDLVKWHKLVVGRLKFFVFDRSGARDLLYHVSQIRQAEVAARVRSARKLLR